MSVSSKVVVASSLAVAAALVFGASRFMPSINQQRRDLQLNWTDDLGKTLPPDMALTQAALGTFRGLAVNVLWQRANTMKEQGNFYEAMQLADWITTLQPRFPQVWEFNSWNMAYNISVATHTAEERWMWVNAGIKILRDRGIPTNPQSLRLYRQLAWTFLHKIGDSLDDFHFDYKMQLADEWDTLLGSPPDGSLSIVLANFRPVADAPISVEELEKKTPSTANAIALLSRNGFRLNHDWLKAIAIKKGELTVDKISTQKVESLLTSDPLPVEVPDEARDAILAFTRAKIIRDEYNMDPKFMLELMQTYGPLDWRHPATHAIYWSEAGLKATDVRIRERLPGSEGQDQLNAQRMVFMALQQLAQKGKINFNPLAGYYSQLPDMRFIDSYDRVFHDLSEVDREMAREDASTGHQNFLEWATRTQFVYGDREAAQRTYEHLRALYRTDNNASRYDQPVDDFVVTELKEMIDSTDDARQVVAGQIRSAIDNGYVTGRRDLAEGFIRRARSIHTWFVTTQLDFKVADAKQGMPPFDDLVADEIGKSLSEPTDSPGRILMKSRLWNEMPEAMRLRTYKQVKDQLEKETSQFGLKFAVAFPAPISMPESTPAAPSKNAPPRLLQR